MEFYAVGQTNRSFGGGPWAHIGKLLAEDMPSIGTALEKIEMTLYCNGSITDHRGFPPLTETPSVRFHRKRRAIAIRHPSNRFTPDEVFAVYTKNLTRAHIVPAMDDMIDALNWGLGKRITAKDDFDVQAFIAWVRSRREMSFDSDEALRAAVTAAYEAEKARQAARDPWERLEVDWDEMHADARSILDDPEDWSEVYEFSPHGNDTGAEIFALWHEYAPLSPHEAALHLGWRLSDMNESDPLFWRDWVRLHLALAFGHIKRRGRCDPALTRAALGVLGTELAKSKAGENWPHREEYINRLHRYLGILEQQGRGSES